MLINSTPVMLEKIISGDQDIAQYLDMQMSNPWTDFGLAPFQYALEQVKENPSDSIWWSWLPILVSENMLIGNCGYKGPPKEGVVEIGYEVAELYRGQGFATEIATALIEHAFSDHRVEQILAHTLAEENASVHILRRCGFRFGGNIDDPDDGPVWRWSLARKLFKK
jgi:RimJ/RimL family protein N-acetyltransferase